MVTDTIKEILIATGCTQVIYEQDLIANLRTDHASQDDIVGLILQPNDITLEVRANAIIEHANPLIIEVMKQVKLEDEADNNEDVLQQLLDMCKEIIVRVIGTGEFRTIPPMIATKIPENKYDANVIGWSLPLDLYWLKNETRDPCLDTPIGDYDT